MDIFLRIAIALLGTVAYDLVAPRLLQDDDGIGTGLIYFTLVVAFAAAWSAFDGYARKTALRAAVIWVAVTVAITVYFPVRDAIQAAHRGDHSLSLLSQLEPSDLVFFLVLVMVPAALGHVLGRLIAPKPLPTS